MRDISTVAGMLRAAVYARFSSDNQREASIEDQLRICHALVDQRGWQVVQNFTDYALTGATALRPGFQALLAAIRNGQVDIVVAEALDRLSRDQEHTAALYKQAQFAGVRIITVAEGEITELHIGLKGTMNALTLRDLARKTHRGLEGRVRAGKNGGGNAYGYRVVRQFGDDGEPIHGDQEINPGEAAIVVRIFEAYAAGQSPKAIAHKLNAAGVAGPRGGKWSQSTINGNRGRGTGILNNELYIGRRVWNRLQYRKDPTTGRRRSQARASKEQVVTEAPDLRIVDQALWDGVKARQARLEQTRPQDADHAPAPFWSKQRPRYLFSGLMRCGVCGGGFSKVSDKHFGCSTIRNKGAAVCTNRATIRQDVLEASALAGLRERLMDPVLFKAFEAEFVREWNRLQSDRDADQEALKAELGRIKAQCDRLVNAIADGRAPASVTAKLHELEARQAKLEAELAKTTAPAPRLHPNLAEVYREKVASLIDALNAEDGEALRERVRGLVTHIALYPEGSSQRVEVHGELVGILGLAQQARGENAALLAEQIKLVAGAGFEPAAFRL